MFLFSDFLYYNSNQNPNLNPNPNPKPIPNRNLNPNLNLNSNPNPKPTSNCNLNPNPNLKPSPNPNPTPILTLTLYEYAPPPIDARVMAVTAHFLVKLTEMSRYFFLNNVCFIEKMFQQRDVCSQFSRHVYASSCDLG